MVPESQFIQVHACKFLDDKWCPKFLLIIAQKNHFGQSRRSCRTLGTKMERFQTFWIQMWKNKPLDESRRSCQTPGTKMAFTQSNYSEHMLIE
ncbi:hypothetical protein Hanom_Chr08g00692031 [Helianthus anomalus]